MAHLLAARLLPQSNVHGLASRQRQGQRQPLRQPSPLRPPRPRHSEQLLLPLPPQARRKAQAWQVLLSAPLRVLALAQVWEAHRLQAVPPPVRLRQYARLWDRPGLDNPALGRPQLACLARQLGRLSGKRVWGNPA